MKSLIRLQKQLIPDLFEVLQERYYILQTVQHAQPIGRRGLAEKMNVTERHVRSEIDLLQKQSLIEVTSKGMYISKEGTLLLEQLADFMRETTDITVLEKEIQDKLNVNKVLIVPGDSDIHEWVKQEMGKACVSLLKKLVKTKLTIAVTGGTTMAAVAEAMSPLQEKCLFVPARGGVGEKVENQASRIVAEMAKKSKGDYRLLYVPDPLSESAYETLINEPSVTDVLMEIKQANIVIHGIGDALTMAKRRKTAKETIAELENNHASAEAFGYYFDHEGKIVHKVLTVGLQLEDLTSIKDVIAVAGGKSKAIAITSYLKQGKSDVLITDEGAALEILKL